MKEIIFEIVGNPVKMSVLKAFRTSSVGLRRNWRNQYCSCRCLSSLKTAPAPEPPNTQYYNTTGAVGATDWPRDGPVYDPSFEKLDLTFDNAKEAYLSKTNSELIRGYLVFQMCSLKLLVEHNKKILKLARSVLGKTLFEKVMKGTFYGHFVAGEDPERIRPVLDRNYAFGVKSILDYSVEMDLSREEAKKVEYEAFAEGEHKRPASHDVQFKAHFEFGDRRDLVTSARTYFYKDEEMCDENLEHFLNGIDAVSGATLGTGFSAIKLTALGRPQLLLQLSEVLTRIRRYYEVLAKGYGTGRLSRADFGRHLKSFELDEEEQQKWFTVLDTNADGEIDLLDWHNLLEVNVSLAHLLRVPNLQTGKLEPVVAQLTDEEMEQMKNLLRRVDTVIQYAKGKDVRVMIDAEQTYFQAAINRLCLEMMRTYNKEKPYVFNTYQCYLKDVLSTVHMDLALAKREDFYFGAKLVRGAYMDQERLRASTLGYEDPICRSFQATTAQYELVLSEAMQAMKEREKGKIQIMIASHNEDTVRFTINKMREYGISSEDRLICFGQLYGMCDQISFSLGQAGYSVYKYVPYGPVEEVLPYLSRRAIENRGVLAKVKKEKQLLRKEIFRRFINFDWFYKPLDAKKNNINSSPPQPNMVGEK